MTSGFSVGPSPGIPPTCQKDCMSFPKTLQGNGYSTAYFGKWHLTPDDMPRRGRSTAGRTRLGSTHFCWLPRRRGRSIRPPRSPVHPSPCTLSGDRSGRRARPMLIDRRDRQKTHHADRTNRPSTGGRRRTSFTTHDDGGRSARDAGRDGTEARRPRRDPTVVPDTGLETRS
jgi:arylsulfatase A-like enzyme